MAPQNRTRLAWMTVTLSVAATIAWLSLKPVGDMPPVQISDKIKHFIAYAGLASPMLLWLGRRRALHVFFTATIFGIAMELAQQGMGLGREGSWLDALANAGGAALGVIVVAIWLSRAEV